MDNGGVSSTGSEMRARLREGFTFSLQQNGALKCVYFHIKVTEAKRDTLRVATLCQPNPAHVVTASGPSDAQLLRGWDRHLPA